MSIKKTVSSFLTFILLLISTNAPIVNAADSEQIIFHHTDHLSGSSIETDKTGTVIEAIDYYPYGEIRVDYKSTTYENKNKFTGKQYDKTDGLYYYGARYYDPIIGRFISADTNEGDQKDPQTFNKYTYVLNNPYKYVDPTGQFAVLAIPAIPLIQMAFDAVAIAIGAHLIQSSNENVKSISAAISSNTNAKAKADTKTQNENDYITLYRGDVPGKNGFIANGIMNKDGFFPGYLDWESGKDLSRSLLDRHERNSTDSLFISTTIYKDAAKYYALGGTEKKMGMIYELRIPINNAYPTGYSDGEYLVPLVISGDKIINRELVYADDWEDIR